MQAQPWYSSWASSDTLDAGVAMVAPPPRSSASHREVARVEADDDAADGSGGWRLEGDITVVAGKSGGKWEIQRPGDKWLITAGERAARSARRYYEGDDKGWGEYTAVIGQERGAIWTRNLGRWCTWVRRAAMWPR